METYIKLKRSNDSLELLKDKNTFRLLTLIALRARRTDKFNVEGLKKNEALIGDFKALKMSRQEHRTALKKLEKWGFITIKTTNKGTIVTICENDIYDINPESNNQQANQRATNRQPSANQRATTNKTVKNEKKVNNGKSKFKNNYSKNKKKFSFNGESSYSAKL